MRDIANQPHTLCLPRATIVTWTNNKVQQKPCTLLIWLFVPNYNGFFLIDLMPDTESYPLTAKLEKYILPTF